MELYGTEGSLYVPDPNFFGGPVMATKRDGAAEAVSQWDHPLGVGNHPDGQGHTVANYRAAGLADLADAVLKRRDPRCSIDRALHAVEIMTSLLASGQDGKFKNMKTTCTRPKPLPPEAARALMG
jgi:predicted dehydrogenase